MIFGILWLAAATLQFAFVATYSGEVPGACAKDCGNYLDMNLPMANFWGRRYVEVLENADESKLIYPKGEN